MAPASDLDIVHSKVELIHVAKNVSHFNVLDYTVHVSGWSYSVLMLASWVFCTCLICWLLSTVSELYSNILSFKQKGAQMRIRSGHRLC